MVAPAHADSLAGIHPDVIASVCTFAERQADLTAACLRAFANKARRHGEDFDGQGLPACFLLELSSVAQLRMWDVNGLRSLLPDDVPSYQEAAADLCARVGQDPIQFRDLKSATLSRRIMRLWLEGFSWSAPTVLGVDVTVGQIDEDALIEAVAQVLWKHRRGASGTIS